MTKAPNVAIEPLGSLNLDEEKCLIASETNATTYKIDIDFIKKEVQDLIIEQTEHTEKTIL